MSLTQINKAGLDEIALDHVFTIGASGSSAYTFQGEGLNGTVNNPTLYLTRGKTYRFENGSGGHPIRIQSTSGASGTAYNTGVTNNAGSGTVIVEVQHDAPDVLYYQCTSHAAMNGILYITGALADGGVTTAKIANDAVTAAKIAANAVGQSEIASGAVTGNELAAGSVTASKIGANEITTAKIADEAVTLAKLPHGTSSTAGKFLRANNGADPTFEDVTSTTINNNAAGRVIFGSSSANTLNASSNVTFNSNILDVNNAVKLPDAGTVHFGVSDTAYVRGKDSTDGYIKLGTAGLDRVTVDPNGQVGMGTTSPAQQAGRGLHIHGTDQTRVKLTNTNSGSTANDGFDIIQEGDSDINIVNHENAVIKFSTNGSEGARVDQSGRFLIGTSTEGFGTADDLTIASSADTGITIRSGTTNQGNIFFSDATSGTGEFSGIIQYTHGTGTGEHLRLFVQSAEKVRLDSDGLKLNGDTAAANALDDYEVGTFTPRLGGSNIGTYNVTGTGSYVKVGRIVTIIIRFNSVNLSNSATGNVAIDGMPFTAGNHASSGEVSVTSDVQYHSVPFPTTSIPSWYLPNNSTAWYGLVSNHNAAWSNFPASDFHANGVYINFHATYTTT